MLRSLLFFSWVLSLAFRSFLHPGMPTMRETQRQGTGMHPRVGSPACQRGAFQSRNSTLQRTHRHIHWVKSGEIPLNIVLPGHSGPPPRPVATISSILSPAIHHDGPPAPPFWAKRGPTTWVERNPLFSTPVQKHSAHLNTRRRGFSTWHVGNLQFATLLEYLVLIRWRSTRNACVTSGAYLMCFSWNVSSIFLKVHHIDTLPIKSFEPQGPKIHYLSGQKTQGRQIFYLLCSFCISQQTYFNYNFPGVYI